MLKSSRSKNCSGAMKRFFKLAGAPECTTEVEAGIWPISFTGHRVPNYPLNYEQLNSDTIHSKVNQGLCELYSPQRESRSNGSCSTPRTLHEKRKGRRLASIFIPSQPAVPDVVIESTSEAVFGDLPKAQQTFGYWLLPQSPAPTAPSFVYLEPFSAKDLYDCHLSDEGSITIRAVIPHSYSLEEQHKSFARVSLFLQSNAIRDVATRVAAIDITVPRGYTGGWATDLDYLPNNFDASQPNLSFPNLISFCWQGAPMVRHCLPAPYYDVNSLPLAQLRKLTIKDTLVSPMDVQRLLNVASNLEVVELTVMNLPLILGSSMQRLECLHLRRLNISSSADLSLFFCMLEAPLLKEVVYFPRGNALTIDSFPWNIVIPSLTRLTLVGFGCVAESVLDILEAALKEENVSLDVFESLEDVSPL